MKTITASARGQLTLPIAMLRAMGLQGKTDFAVVQDGDRIVLRPAAAIGKRELDDLSGWQTLAEPALAQVWANAEDEVWNDL